MDLFETLQEKVKNFDTSMSMFPINPRSLIFEERVLLKCFYCSRYDTKWTCPPRIPNLDYKTICNEYQNAAVVMCEIPFEGKIYEEIREKSTNDLHKALLHMEKILWDLDNPLTLTFIGGSCKLCKNGCAEEKCRNPGLKRIPIEATGINVIKSLESIGIKISFIENRTMRRFGLILW